MPTLPAQAGLIKLKIKLKKYIMNRVPLWIKDIMMYRDLLKNYKLTTREKKDIKQKINKLFIAILTRRLIERTFEPSIDREKFIYDMHENKKDIEDEYGSPIEMLRLIANSNIQEQPGSLNKTYFYQYDKSKKYKFSKLLNYIYLILNDFFGTFYGFISKPIYLFTQNKLTIYINYYIPSWKKKKLKIIRIGNKVIKYYILVDRYPKLVARNRWKYGRYPAQTGKQLKFEFTQLVKILSNLLFSTNPSMHADHNAQGPMGRAAQGAGPLLSHNKPKVVLQLRRLRHAYLDSTILSKFIALNSNKKKKSYKSRDNTLKIYSNI